MILSKVFSITLLSAALNLTMQAASSREVITTTEIAAAIRSAGLDVSAEQVGLMSDVFARTSKPVLRVESVGAWEGNLARVRMDCASGDECLPFVVMLRRNQGKDANATFVPPNLQSGKRPLDALKVKVVVRSGSSAILLLDGGRVHIQLAVICLENGVVGQTIRVASRGRDHTYMAEVCSDGLLRGSL